jgi:hypothetical protein
LELPALRNPEVMLICYKFREAAARCGVVGKRCADANELFVCGSFWKALTSATGAKAACAQQKISDEPTC